MEAIRVRNLWMAWHTVRLTRAKKMPSLKSLLQKPKNVEAQVLHGEELARRRSEFDRLTRLYQVKVVGEI